jgi:hypothetical protein
MQKLITFVFLSVLIFCFPVEAKSWLDCLRLSRTAPAEKHFQKLAQKPQLNAYAENPQGINELTKIFSLDKPQLHMVPLEHKVPVEYLEILQKRVKGELNPVKLSQKEQQLLISVDELIKNVPMENLEKSLEVYQRSHIIETNEGRFFTGLPQLPPPKQGHIRIYRGTGNPETMEISKSYRGRDVATVPRGDQEFLSPMEGRLHSGSADSGIADGISVSTNYKSAASFGSHVKVYDVPRSIYEQLPTGDPALYEKVFKYSIPDDYLINVMPKNTFKKATEIFPEYIFKSSGS